MPAAVSSRDALAWARRCACSHAVCCLLLLLCAAPLDAQVRVDKTTWQGHDALKLSNGTVELVVTTGIGPRIIRYAFVGGENILAELAATPATTTALGDWKPWGGHRLWAAPESMPGSYGPDNGPVQAQVSGNRVTLTQPRDAAGLEKQITVTLAETGTGVTIGHRLTNATPWTLDLSAWALTIMNGGGMVIIPNEPLQVARRGAAARRARLPRGPTPICRIHAGRSAASTSGCAPTPALNAPQKIGVANRRGWAGYLRNDTLFVKRVDWDETAAYPDFGVNTETYTSANFIELETLGPLRKVAPGGAPRFTRSAGRCSRA